MAKQTFQVGIEFIANVNDLQSKIKNVTGDIAKMGSTSGGSQIQKQFDQLTRTVENLHTRAQQPINSQAEFNKLTGDVSRAEMAYDNLIGSIERLKGLTSSKKLELLDPTQQKRISDAANAVKTYENATAGAAQKQRDLEKAQERVAQQRAKIAGLKTAQQEAAVAVQRHKDKLTLLEASQEDVINAEKRLQQATEQGAGEKTIAKLTLSLQQAKTQAEELGVKFTKNSSTTQAFSSAIERTSKDIDRLSQSTQNINLAKEFGTATADLNRLEQELQELQGQNPTAQLQAAFEQLKTKAQSLGVSLEGIDDVSSIEQLKQRLLALKQQGLDQVDAKIDNVAASMNGDLRPALNNVRSGLNDATAGFQQFNRQAQEVEQLKSQLGYFFSLTNSVYLLRSALQSAFETVKELDAVMTETAVVTTNSVGDMWEKLPEYAAAASALGSSIKDVYAATTLYYQQGLKANEAMTVGVETMKMARIANMDAAEATQAMTAALRGFKMEVNETNALRVNDVYSNLAAITAADTEQIATAMSKTASIAASANMEFETTAALLAQIIETTQEAPETAGTALKTIIARFSEVKELQNQGKASGEDSEGESIDVNKIDKALSSVGISMDAFFAGTEGLDSVLMRLAEKWDTLDFTTQRYIATMAAGSRQQSRFIAMMSDYSRTTELVSAANNSAGASQKQFDKTMESLEAKLNKLKVAWDQFTMGIADNQLIKVGIDLLTGLLETINKLLSGLPGLTQSFASLALVFVALRAGGALLNKALSGISGIVAKSFAEAGVVASKTAEASGQVAGAKMAMGTAKGTNNPAAQAALFKSYNLLILKLQSTLPPVTIKTALAPGSSASVKALWAEVSRLKLEEEKVAATYGKASPQYKEIRKQRLLAAQAAQAARTANTAETLSIEGTSIAISKEMAAKIKEGTITKTQLALLGPESAARVSNALAAGREANEIEELVWAKTTENNLKKGGLAAFFTEIGLRVMNKTATDKEKIGIWGVVKAKLAEAAAWIKANSAMLIGVGIAALYVAAIAILVVGLIKLFSLGNREKGTTKQMNSLNKELTEVQEQLSEINEEMDKMKQQKSGLKSLQEEFKNLNRGSQEWQEKLLEINSTVLELINTYPLLAEYVQRSSEGTLTISEEGWNQLNQQMLYQKTVAMSSQAGIQMQKTEIEQQMAFEEAQRDYVKQKFDYEDALNSTEVKSAAMWTGAGITGLAGVGAGIAAGGKLGATLGSFGGPAGVVVGGLLGLLLGGGLGALAGAGVIEGLDFLNGSQEELEKKTTGGLTADDFSNFAAAAAEQGITLSGGSSPEEFKRLYEQMGLDKIGNFDEVFEKIKQMGSDFDELGIQTNKLNVAQQAHTQTLLDAAGQGDPDLSNNEYYEQAQEAASGVFANAAETIEANKKAILEDKEYVKNGEATEKLIAEYAEITKMTKDQVRDKIEDDHLSAETMASEIATAKSTEEARVAMINTTKELERLATAAKNGGKDISSLSNTLSDQGRGLKRSDFASIAQITGMPIEELVQITNPDRQKEIVDQYLAQYGTSTEQLGVVPSTIFNNWKEGYAAMQNSIQSAQRIGIDTTSLSQKDLSSELINSILSKISIGATTFGSAENHQMVYDLIEQWAPSDPEKLERYYQILSDTDWTNREDVEGISAELYEEGIISEDDIEGFGELEQEIIDLSVAATSVSFDDAINGLSDFVDMANKIAAGEQGKIFNKEDYEKIIKTAPDLAKDFVKTSENAYVYIGNNLNDLGNYLVDHAVRTTEEATAKAEDDYLRVQEDYRELEEGTARYGTQHQGLSVQTLFSGLLDEEGNVQEGVTLDTLSPELKSTFFTLLNGTITDGMAENAGLEKGATFEEWLMKVFPSEDPSQPYDFAKAIKWLGTDLGTVNNDKNQIYNSVTTSNRNFGGTEEKYTIGRQVFQEGSYLDIIEGLISGELTTEWNPQVGKGIITNDILENIFSIIGTDTQKDSIEKDENGNITQQGYKQIFGFITAYMGGSGNRETVKTNLENQKEDYQSQFATMETGQDVINHKSKTEIEEQQKSVGLDARVAARDGEMLVNQFASGLDKDYAAELGEEKASNFVKALTSDYIDNQKAIKQAGKVLQEYSSVLIKSKRGTAEYSQALSKVKPALEAAFGKEISEEVLQEHADLIERIVAGDMTAVAELRTELSKDTFEEYTKGVEGVVTTYEEAVDAALNMANVSPEIGIVSTYDPTGEYAAKLGIQSISGEIEANEENLNYLKELYSDLSYTMTYTTKTMYKDPETGLLAEKDGGGWEAVEVIDKITTVKNDDRDWSGGGSSGGGDGSSNKWENPYDEFYNTVEKINEELRKREKLELRYQRLLDRNAATAAEIARLTQEQLASLQVELSDREELLRGRERQMAQIESEYSDVSQYAWFNEKTQQIEIRWDLLEGLDGSTDEELTARIEEYISKLEEQQDLIESEKDAIEEIKDTVWEIYTQGKDEYIDLENMVKDAIVSQRQDEIDKLSEINDTINDTNSKLLDSMQKQIDEYRQNRDNAKTEEEIADKQRKLAYLQQDTSGANALEILKLQEEIDQAQEDYTDTLIDQKISELQEQNDRAAEQRQEQIDILQAQLDQDVDSGAIWQKVNELMAEGLDPNTGLVRGSDLEALLQSADGYAGLSHIQQMDWLNDLNNTISQGFAWLSNGATSYMHGENGEVTFTNADGTQLTGTVDSLGNVVTSDGQMYSATSFTYNPYDGTVTSNQTTAQAQQNWVNSQPPKEPEKKPWSYSYPMPSTGSSTLRKGSSGDRVRGLQQALKDLGYNVGEVDGAFGNKTHEAVKKFQTAAKEWSPDIGSPDGQVGPKTRKAFATHPTYQFKTGGLADFTGPAWLDGTKSKPEYVLNADQTKAFFTLVDVLGSLQTGSSQTTQNSGDNTYDIDINVESIGSDYDVEQLAEVVKRMINDDARYRNNNTIGGMR